MSYHTFGYQSVCMYVSSTRTDPIWHNINSIPPFLARVQDTPETAVVLHTAVVLIVVVVIIKKRATRKVVRFTGKEQLVTTCMWHSSCYVSFRNSS